MADKYSLVDVLGVQYADKVIAENAHIVLHGIVRSAGGRTWALTATPILNRPPELWNLLRVLGAERETYGSWAAFVRAFDGSQGRWGGYEWGTPRAEAATSLARVQLRRRKVDVLADLPEKRIENHIVNGLPRSV